MSREIDWDLIATLYADHSLKLREIARRSGVSAAAISRRAKREGWPMRRPHTVGPQPQRKFRLLIDRMIRALDRQMGEIEERLAEAGSAPSARNAAERERDARTLASLSRTLEKLRDLEREAARTARAERTARTAADDEAGVTDVQALLAELGRRLARLAEPGDPAGVPEQSE